MLFRHIQQRLLRGEPIQYILGEADFLWIEIYGRPSGVNSSPGDGRIGTLGVGDVERERFGEGETWREGERERGRRGDEGS